MQFIPDFTLLYLKLDIKYIVFESVNQYSKLKITVADAVSYHKVDDPDFKYINLSLMDFILINGAYASTKINKISIYGAKIEGDSIICDLAALKLSNAQSFIVDPSNFWGITFAGAFYDKGISKINGKYNDIVSGVPTITFPLE